MLQRIVSGNGVEAARFSLAPMTVKGKQAAGRDGLTSLLQPGLFSLTVQLALLGKFSIAAAFKVAYIISGEIFATSLRNSGVGSLKTVLQLMEKLLVEGAVSHGSV